jgi:formate dehydrogenase maturation protein FdhE
MTRPGGEPVPPEQIVRRLEALLPSESVSEDYVRLRIGVFQAQVTALDTLHTGQLFEAIVAACRLYGEAGDELARLESAVRSRPELLDELTRAAALAPDEQSLHSLARQWQVSAPLLLFLGRLLAAPFLAQAARAVRQPEPASPESVGWCPVCGSTPALASLDAEDGGRLLHCSLCGRSWPFARLVCPFCGNEDQSSLTRLVIDGQDARWIEACQGCMHYLKTVDLRRLAGPEPFIPLVEEVAGLYLDLVAQREGYAAKPPYAAVG